MKEINFRIADAANASRELCCSSRRSQVDLPKHWLLVNCLCVSRLAYGAHTGSKWTVAQMSKLASVYDGFAGRAASKAFCTDENRCTADAALAVCRALSFDLHLRYVRLAYLCRLAILCPDVLWAVLDVQSLHWFPLLSSSLLI